jgi:uncharacterized protein
VPNPNLDTVRAIYQAFAAGDLPGVLGRLSHDISWTEADNFPYADGNPYIGPQAVAAGVFARCAGEWHDFAATPHEFLDAGDAIIVLGRYTGTYKATGRPQNTQFVHVWRLAHGKVTRFQQFADTLHVARVIGTAAG